MKYNYRYHLISLVWLLFFSSQVLSDTDKHITKEYLIDGLVIKTISDLTNNKCKYGGDHTIIIEGAIGPDSSFAVGTLIKKLQPCMNDENHIVTPIKVILNSDGGFLDDGYKLGEIFRDEKVKTIIADDTLCASSCAVAFLGGKYRTVATKGQVLFHAPYREKMDFEGKKRIDCQIPEARLNELNQYYKKMTNSNSGDRLFDRTMKYCSSNDGWIIQGSSAAELYDIATEEFSITDLKSFSHTNDISIETRCINEWNMECNSRMEQYIVISGLECDHLESKAKKYYDDGFDYIESKFYLFTLRDSQSDSISFEEICVSYDNLNREAAISCGEKINVQEDFIAAQFFSDGGIFIDKNTLIISLFPWYVRGYSRSDAAWKKIMRSNRLKDKFRDYQCKVNPEPLKLYDYVIERKKNLLSGDFSN